MEEYLREIEGLLGRSCEIVDRAPKIARRVKGELVLFAESFLESGEVYRELDPAVKWISLREAIKRANLNHLLGCKSVRGVAYLFNKEKLQEALQDPKGARARGLELGILASIKSPKGAHIYQSLELFRSSPFPAIRIAKGRCLRTSFVKALKILGLEDQIHLSNRGEDLYLVKRR